MNTVRLRPKGLWTGTLIGVRVCDFLRISGPWTLNFNHGVLREEILGQNLKMRIPKLMLCLYISVTFILYDFYPQCTVLRGPEIHTS